MIFCTTLLNYFEVVKVMCKETLPSGVAEPAPLEPKLCGDLEPEPKLSL